MSDKEKKQKRQGNQTGAGAQTQVPAPNPSPNPSERQAQSEDTYINRKNQAEIYAEKIYRALNGRGSLYDFMCHCPAHDDTNPSLHVTLKNQKLLVHCHAGCPQEKVLSILKQLGLWPSQSQILPPGIPREYRGYYFVSYWAYRNENNETIGYVVRYEDQDGNKQILPFFKRNNGKWQAGIPENLKEKRPLYRLDALQKDTNKTVVITEGEKAADAAQRLLGSDFICTTSLGGAQAASKTNWSPIKGRKVIIWPDADIPGLKYTIDVIRILQQQNTSIKGIVDFEQLGLKLGSKKDAADLDALESLPLLTVKQFTEQYTEKYLQNNKSIVSATIKSKGKKKDIKKQAIEIARKSMEFFLDQLSSTTYFSYLDLDSNKKIVAPIESEKFRVYLTTIVYSETGQFLNQQNLKDITRVLVGQTYMQNKKRYVFNRLGYLDGKIYLDLANEQGEIVEVSENFWQVRKDTELPEVFFIRDNDMLPLPRPSMRGDITALKQLLNLNSEEDFLLVVSWLIGALRPYMPTDLRGRFAYPILSITGPQGSSKTTATIVLKSLIDPRRTNIETQPANERDLILRARQNWVLAYDNITNIPGDMSDALARMSTGAGLSTRKLYTDSDLVTFNAARPIILNSIPDVITRSDLADRSIFVILEPIPEKKRIDENEFWEKSYQLQPIILSALLDSIASALANYSKIKLQKSPRMVSFAKWVYTALPGVGIYPNDFLNVYMGNKEDAIRNLAQEDILATSIITVLEGSKNGNWEGTIEELLSKLNENVDEDTRRMKIWPKTPRSLGRRLSVVQPLLDALGVSIKRDRTREKRIIKLHFKKQEDEKKEVVV